MTQEEKAKAYDEIREKARKEYSIHEANNAIGIMDALERVFPELKESEDERIKKCIGDIVREYDWSHIFGVTKDDCLAWIEKQSTPQVRTGLEWVNTIDDACDKRYLEEYAHGEYCHEQSFKWGFQEGVDWLEKQGEQKPAFEMKTPEESLGVDSDTYNKIVDECIYGEQKPIDKVEHKFKVGDEIKTANEESLTITKIDDKGYWSVDLFICDFDEEYLWDLVEQKPADKVEPKLKIEVNKWYICISQYCNCIEGRCYMAPADGRIIDDFGTEYDMHSDAYKYFRLWTIQDAKDGDILTDKQNCTCIFREIMTDDEEETSVDTYCGINIDNEFVANKKGEVWTVSEDLFPATKEQRDLLFQKMKEAGYEWDAEKKELKKIELNSAWSREDERLCSCLIEEQEEALDNVKNDKYGHSEIISDLKEMYNERIDWLKSLKDRYTWKPSDKQMQALSNAGNSFRPFEEGHKVLWSLYNDLKKLIEE